MHPMVFRFMVHGVIPMQTAPPTQKNDTIVSGAQCDGRTTLPNGTTAPSPGPAINTQYPLGAFIQDYEYLAASGDLDEHNGRFLCYAPEYPLGTYAYFVTIDAALLPVFPFTMTETYYGVVQAGNTGRKWRSCYYK